MLKGAGQIGRLLPTHPRYRALHSKLVPARNAQTRVMTSLSSQRSLTNLIVVGDVHGLWDESDVRALEILRPDALVFVGDIGNQDVELIERVSALKESYNLVAVLGNHDAWYTLTERGRKRAIKNALQSSNLKHFTSLGDTGAYTKQQILDMLEALGEAHVGYSNLAFDGVRASFAGGRPFSKGGVQWSAVKDFYETYYGVSSMEESGERILDALMADGGAMPLVVVAHNGPSGLGSHKHDPCGVDFMEPEDDFGDPDLEEALETAYMSCGRHAALVLFGHMHHRLKYGGLRNMVSVDERMGAVYLNAAVVPRVVHVDGNEGEAGKRKRTKRHFLRVLVGKERVERAENVWVEVTEDQADEGCPDRAGSMLETVSLAEEDTECILERISDNQYRIFKAHTNEWIDITFDH
jgi:uncharacterized protein (TIGR04168 family)